VEVDGDYMTVQLTNSYVSPVVVCSVQYNNNAMPVVARVSNVTSESFDVRLQNPSGGAVAAEKVSYLVVEEGVWTIDGVNIEAQTYLSTITDENNSWIGETQSYGQSYTNPVVLGQVMSENDTRWSVFWCQGRRRTKPPSATALKTGKTVCEDTDVTRVDETVGFIVFEAGHGTIGGVEFEALVGADTVKGVTDSPPYTYSFDTAFDLAPQVAVTTMAGMDGRNGGWAYVHGPTLATTTTLYLSIDEDEIGDSECSHTSEQVGYVVFGSPVVYTAAPECDGDEDCDDGLYCNGKETCVDGTCQAGSDPCPGQGCDEENDECVAGPTVVDNPDAQFVCNWTCGLGVPAAYGGDRCYRPAGDGSCTATWTPNLGAAASYDVYAWWDTGANRATNAPYTIYYDGGSDSATVEVNQQENGCDWYPLGNYYFVGGMSSEYVKLSDDSDDVGYVMKADAIKLKP